MSISVASISHAGVSRDPGAGGPSFTLSPAATHVTGVLSLTATGSGTTWTTNPFSILSGPASTLANYVNLSTTSATFDITVTSISSTPIIIADSDSGTVYNVSAAAIAPNAPTSVVVTDLHNGTVSVAFTQSSDTGGSAITSNTATWSSGQSATGLGSPLIVTIPNRIAGTATVHSSNAFFTGPESTASNSVTPDNFLVVYFTEEVTFPTGTTVGTASYSVRHIVAGVLTDVVSWVTTGMVATPNMTGVGSQPAGYTINASLTPNNADSGFTGILLVRNSPSSPVYVVKELNIQATVTAGVTVRMCKIAPFLSTDVFTTPGRRAYVNSNATDTALEARQTTGNVAIPEIVNGYCANVDVTPAGDGSFQGFVLWDQDNTLFVQDKLVFESAGGSGGSPVTGGGGSIVMTRVQLGQ